MDFQLVYVTFASQDEASNIADRIVSERLASCANIFPPLKSIYWWEGEIHRDDEVAVIFKMTKAGFNAFKGRLVDLHSYDTPCVVALDIADGHQPFLSWIHKNTA